MSDGAQVTPVKYLCTEIQYDEPEGIPPNCRGSFGVRYYDTVIILTCETEASVYRL